MKIHPGYKIKHKGDDARFKLPHSSDPDLYYEVVLVRSTSSQKILILHPYGWCGADACSVDYNYKKLLAKYGELATFWWVAEEDIIGIKGYHSLHGY